MAQYTSYTGKTYDTLLGGGTFDYNATTDPLSPITKSGTYQQFKDSTTGEIVSDFYDGTGSYKTSLSGYESGSYTDLFNNFLSNATSYTDFNSLSSDSNNSISQDGYDAIKIAEAQLGYTKDLQDYTFAQDKEFEQIQLGNAITLGDEQLANTKELNEFNYNNDVNFANLELANAIKLADEQLANTQSLNASNLQNDITFDNVQKQNAIDLADAQLANTLELNQATLANDIAFEQSQLQNAISLADNQLTNDKDFASFTDEITRGQSEFNSQLLREEAEFTNKLNRDNKEFSIATARDAYSFGNGSIGGSPAANQGSRSYYRSTV